MRVIALLMAATLVFVCGCAPKSIKRKAIVLGDKPFVRKVATGKTRTLTSWKIEKDRLYITAKKEVLCQRKEGVDRSYRVDTIRETDNVMVTGFSISAGTFIGLGVLFFFLPPSWKDRDGRVKTSEEIQKNKNSNLTFAGVFAGIGVLCLVGAVGSAIRGTDTKGPPQKKRYFTRRTTVPCAPAHPFQNAKARFVIPGSPEKVKRTDARGQALFALPKNLGSIKEDAAEKAYFEVANTVTSVALGSHPSYLAARQRYLAQEREKERKRHEQERKQREEKERLALEKYTKALKDLKARFLKKSRLMNAKEFAVLCKLPKKPCAEDGNLDKHEPVKVIASRGRYLALAKETFEGEISAKHIKGWVEKKYLLPRKKYERRLAREAKERARSLEKKRRALSRKLAGFELLWSKKKSLQEIEKGWFLSSKKRGKCGAVEWHISSSLGSAILRFFQGRLFGIIHTTSRPVIVRGYRQLNKWRQQIRSKDKRALFRLVSLRDGSLVFIARYKDKRTRNDVMGKGRKFGYAPILNMNAWAVMDRRLAARAKRCKRKRSRPEL